MKFFPFALVLFLSGALIAGCSDALVDTAPNAASADLALKGKPGGTPDNTSSPKVISVDVREASDGDKDAFAEAMSDGYLVETSMGGAKEYFSGTNSGTAPVEFAEYWGCPDDDLPCRAVTLVASGYAASDLIRLVAYPVNRDPGCNGTFDVIDSYGNTVTVGNSCAHDTGFAPHSGLPSVRRQASLFVSATATPYIRFDNMNDMDDGTRSFTFLWQGQTAGPLTADGGTARVYFPDDFDSYPGAAPASGAYVRFQPVREGYGGASIEMVDCLFDGEGSNCITEIIGHPRSEPIDGLSVIATQVDFLFPEMTHTVGRGKKAEEVTTTSDQLSVTTNFEPDPELGWGVILATGGGIKTLVTKGRPLDDQLAETNAPPGTCFTLKLIEYEWYHAHLGQDYVLPEDLASASTTYQPSTGAFRECTP